MKNAKPHRTRTSDTLRRLREGVSVTPKDRLRQLADAINQEHAAVDFSFKEGIGHALRVGELLTAAKKLLKHGEWLPWIAEHCDFNRILAWTYMKMAAHREEIAHLTWREAMRVLAAGSVENPLMSSASDKWNSPKEIVDLACRVLGAVDLDPCCNDGPPNVQALEHLRRADDGLSRPWIGRVYMNPPYGEAIGLWVEKLLTEYRTGHVTEAIALVPARVDTEWFRAFRDFAVCFVSGRLKFSGHENSATFPSAIVYLGSDVEKFAATYSPVGDIWVRLK